MGSDWKWFENVFKTQLAVCTHWNHIRVGMQGYQNGSDYLNIAVWYKFEKSLRNGLLTRYAKYLVAHAPAMPGTFSLPSTSKETADDWSRHTSRHVRHTRAVIYVGITNPQLRGRHSRHSRRMHNPKLYVSGKSSITNDVIQGLKSLPYTCKDGVVVLKGMCWPQRCE